MPCPVCIAWSFPLYFQPRSSDGAVRLMNYQENILYALHILHHQTRSNWQGEIVYGEQPHTAPQFVLAHFHEVA